jgi:hypothetical protein
MEGAMAGDEGVVCVGRHPTKMVVPSVTKATSSASNVTSMGTTLIIVQEVRRRRGDEAHHARVDNIKLALMLTVMEVPKLFELVSRVITGVQGNAVFLDERKVMPELHLTGGNKKAGDAWYLDNGASNHMSGNASMFRDLNEEIIAKVRFGDGSAMEIMGIRTLMFQCKNGYQWLLLDVYYIPILRSNLISLGQLTETRHIITMDDD